MPTYLAHGGLTALSHDQEQYPVIDGVVELPDGAVWQLDLVACGALEPISARPLAVAIATPEPESEPVLGEMPAPEAPAPVEPEAAPVATEPEPVAQIEAPTGPAPEAPKPQPVEMFSTPAAAAPVKPVKRRGGRG